MASLNNCLSQIREGGNPDIIVMGDVNIDLAVRAKGHDKTRDTRFLTLNNLSQLIKEPSRVTERSATIIDHIYTNRPEWYPVHGRYDPGLSDHYLIFAARRRHKKEHKTNEVNGRNYRFFNEENFRHDVDSTDWSSVYNAPTSSSAAIAFMEILFGVINKHAPEKLVKSSNDH